MNAAVQRRLTPIYGAAVLCFGVILLTLLFGVGRGVSWNPPRATPKLPAAHNVPLPVPPPLQSYARVWEHPLFSPDRKPIVTNSGSEGVSLGDLKLTGIILTPDLHMALLGPTNSKADGNEEVRVREGTTLPDGNWKLIKVLPRSAIFASPTGRTELKLPAGAPIDQPAPSTSPQGAIPMNSPEQKPAVPGRQGAVMRQAPMPPPRSNEQVERLQKLRAAILKQRSRQAVNAQGEH